jgi:hypothetical protein
MLLGEATRVSLANLLWRERVHVVFYGRASYLPDL